MDQTIKFELEKSILAFQLPQYDQIPNVGLYLEQVSKYISEYLGHLGDFTLTGSMISNYVKKGLITNPVKKQYDREQVAYLFFIAVAKSVLSMENLRRIICLQQNSYSVERAYTYFRDEMENVLHYVFGFKTSLETLGEENTEEKMILRNTIITIAHKVYLDKYFAAMPTD